MLFGEYGILYGTKALSIPYHTFGGSLQKKSENKSSLKEFYQHIQLKNHLLKYRINLKLLKYDLKENLTFSSNIPVGYGLGSSGALTAAVYNDYNLDLPEDLLTESNY